MQNYLEVGIRLGLVFAVIFVSFYKKEKTVSTFFLTASWMCLVLAPLWPLFLLGMAIDGPDKGLKNLAGKVSPRHSYR